MTEQTQPATRRTDGAETTRDILAAAHRLFTTIGYRKTTVADIAAELGMSPANVYRFFDSKRSINEAVAQLILGQIGDALEAVASSGEGSPAQRMAEVLRTLARLSEESFMSNKRMYDMVEDGMADSWGVCGRYIERCHHLVLALLRDGCERGEFAIEDPVTGARCVHAAVVCYAHPAMIAQRADRPSASIEQMATFVVRGLGARV